MEDFEKLGALVETRWKAENYNEELLECLLLGLSEEEMNQRATEQYPAENAVELIAIVPAITDSLRSSTLIKSLLAD